MSTQKLISKAINKAWLKKKKTPRVLTLSVTDTCTRDCVFCKPPGNDDLPTEVIIKIIRQAKDAGVVRLNLTGGEPLFRNDIGEIIKVATSLELEVDLWTNGDLVEYRIDDLMGLRAAVIGLDGPQNLHDELRGEASYSYAVGAARLLQMKGIKATFASLITADSVFHIDAVLDAAKRSGADISFMPASKKLYMSAGDNPVAEDFPQYRRHIDGLVDRKQNHPNIINSVNGLKQLREWPDKCKLNRCLWQYVHAMIDADGQMRLCHELSIENRPPSLNVLELGFENAFEQLEPTPCEQCWGAARVEMYLAANKRPRPTILWPLLKDSRLG